MTGVLAMLFCAVVGTARMEGVLGAQVDAVIRERICSADAKGPIYDEAEGAFATCWDGRTAYAMWAIEGKVKVDLPADAVGGTIYDLMGNSRRLDPARTEVELTERPHYLVCGGEK